jgi:3-hydroxypropanoate dehydrogenase
MAERLPDAALDQLFRNARTANGWRDVPVPEETLRALYDLAKWGPTSANIQPLRLKFLVSRAAKERLRPHLSPGNVEKTMAAPVVAILGQDLAFYEHLPRMFPHNPEARSWFAGKPDHIAVTALRNASLQGGYFILAARALGLDAGPMSGFDPDGVDREFWSGTTVETNFLCNLGHADPAKTFPRSPRFDFSEVCEIL